MRMIRLNIIIEGQEVSLFVNPNQYKLLASNIAQEALMDASAQYVELGDPELDVAKLKEQIKAELREELMEKEAKKVATFINPNIVKGGGTAELWAKVDFGDGIINIVKYTKQISVQEGYSLINKYKGEKPFDTKLWRITKVLNKEA